MAILRLRHEEYYAGAYRSPRLTFTEARNDNMRRMRFKGRAPSSNRWNPGVDLRILRQRIPGRTSGGSEQRRLSVQRGSTLYGWKRDLRDVGPDPVQGVAGYGSSVHEALHDLADQLVKCGVWIDVTDRHHPFNWESENEV
jgi:hypothetical protein